MAILGHSCAHKVDHPAPDSCRRMGLCERVGLSLKSLFLWMGIGSYRGLATLTSGAYLGLWPVITRIPKVSLLPAWLLSLFSSTGV